MKGCIKFAFFPNGWAVEQFPLAGRVVTAYGRYHVRGTVLKIGWKRYEPTEICVPISDRKSGVDKQCMPTARDDLKGEFQFEGPNALLWNTPSTPQLRLVRVEL